ncbi:hypothetical protein BCR42DRAFT_463233 [Absidia repens]|uniref:Uncharacterized protein n=1 Tax=Absidia repens TaxID=90262 RepID=A0A1X2I1I2_9FUNG|nr:hypothetical protein BCR42DRAFT_463233 [Absidia repens]
MVSLTLVDKLPRMPLQETISEYELTTPVRRPISLWTMFDDPENGLYSPLDRSSYFFEAMESFGEKRKSAHHERSTNYLDCRDLLRIGMFCKSGLDERTMEGGLGIQAIGRTITFYLFALPAAGLYGYALSSSLDDLSKLVLAMPHVILVLDVFCRHYKLTLN